MLGLGPGESAAPSISSFGAWDFCLRIFEGAGAREGSFSEAVRRADRMPRFLIRSAGSSFRRVCSSEASLTLSR